MIEQNTAAGSWKPSESPTGSRAELGAQSDLAETKLWREESLLKLSQLNCPLVASQVDDVVALRGHLFMIA